MSDLRHVKLPLTLFNAKAATGVSGAIPVEYYRHLMVTIAGNATANLTVKCQGSLGITVANDAAPTFSSAKSVANMWDYVAMYDYQDGSLVAGDTGVAFAAAADVRNFLINVDGLKWLSLEVSTYTAGEVTVILMAADNK